LRVSGSAGSAGAHRARARLSRVAARVPRDGVRAAAQRAVEARARGGVGGRPQRTRIVTVVPAVAAPVGMAHAGELVGGAALPARDEAKSPRPARLPARTALRDARRVR